MFEGKEILLNKYCATFMTINPDHKGRHEIPDNLKGL